MRELFALNFNRNRQKYYLWIMSSILVINFVPVCGDISSRIINDNVLLHSSDEFFKHEIIKPTLQHRQQKSDIVDTRVENGLHADELILRYIHGEKDVIIDLKLNNNFIPREHFMRYQLPNGTDVVQHFTKAEIELCHYRGTIRNNAEAHVAVSTCDGIKGVIYDVDETYYIDTKPNGSIGDEHFLYRQSDRIQNQIQNSSCAYNTHEDGETTNKDSEINGIFRNKRSTDTVIRGPYYANGQSSFVEFVFVVDNMMYKSFGKNLKKVHKHCKDLVNIVNALYAPLNIVIVLMGIVVWNERNEIEISRDSGKTLHNFLQYRRKVLISKHPNDNAQLLTKDFFDGGVVGKAFVGHMCTYSNSGGIVMEHSNNINDVAVTVAHEMGHNFGMRHDTPDCKCKEDKCIMAVNSPLVAPIHWSSCSIDQLNFTFHRGINYCLRNKPTKMFDMDSAQCGNGFVEPGEQCDCGLPEFCQNPCCNPNTCMFRSNASCATGECCDLSTCHPRTAGTVCRTADGECDLPEYCTGESEYCPQDYFKRDTELCGGGKAYCYKGACLSHTDQCKLLWGPSGRSVDECYKQNMKGDRFGNCGYDRVNKRYKKCLEEDMKCGILQCEHLNASLQFGWESAAEMSHSYITTLARNKFISCQAVTFDIGLENVDPGLTPNGAICGKGKMCVRQKCLSVHKIRASGIGIECPKNCNGHGICDNKGNCHCDKGFAPPLCNSSVYEGSSFNKPASNSSGIGVKCPGNCNGRGICDNKGNCHCDNGFAPPLCNSSVYEGSSFNKRASNDGSVFVTVLIACLVGVVLLLLLISLLLCCCKKRKNTAVQRMKHAKIEASGSSNDMNSLLLKPYQNTDSNGITNYSPLLHSEGNTPNINAPNVVYSVSRNRDTSKIPTAVPSRAAPPAPKIRDTPPIPKLPSDVHSQVQPMETDVNRLNFVLPSNFSSEIASAVLNPLLKPIAASRPFISRPELESSTYSAKELI